MTAARIPASVLALAFLAAPALAQGRGHGGGPHSPPPRGSTVSTSSSQERSIVPGVGLRNFGAWLDDATIADPGDGWASVWLSYWRSPLGRQLDAPVVDLGFAATPRIQVGLSVPYYDASYVDGFHAHGLGDTYFNAKIGLLDPTRVGHHVGVSITPLLEIPGSGGALNNTGPERRWHWALPVNVEVRGQGVRVYGSAGYFSRGALFGSGALEASVTPRLALVGALIHSYSTKDDPLSDARGLSKTRTDVSGGASLLVAPSVTVFGNIGRSLSRSEDSSATLAASVGATFSFARRPHARP